MHFVQEWESTKKKKKRNDNKQKYTLIGQYSAGNMHKWVIKYVYYVVIVIILYDFCIFISQNAIFDFLSLTSEKKKWIFNSRKMLLVFVDMFTDCFQSVACV